MGILYEPLILKIVSKALNLYKKQQVSFYEFETNRDWNSYANKPVLSIQYIKFKTTETLNATFNNTNDISLKSVWFSEKFSFIWY